MVSLCLIFEVGIKGIVRASAHLIVWCPSFTKDLLVTYYVSGVIFGTDDVLR